MDPRHRGLEHSREVGRDVYTDRALAERERRERDKHTERERDRYANAPPYRPPRDYEFAGDAGRREYERLALAERERERERDRFVDKDRERYVERGRERLPERDPRYESRNRDVERERERYTDRARDHERDRYADLERERERERRERDRYSDRSQPVDTSRHYDRDYRDERYGDRNIRGSERDIRDLRERERYSMDPLARGNPRPDASNPLISNDRYRNGANFMDQSRFQNPTTFFPHSQFPFPELPLYPPNPYSTPQSHPSLFMPPFPHPSFYPYSHPSNLTNQLIPPTLPFAHSRHYHSDGGRRSDRHEGTLYTTELPQDITEKYRAAGVLPYSFDAKGAMYLLLGCEDRTGKRKYPDRGQDMSRVWLHFGGKKEPDEQHPASTAIREMDEETGGVFNKQMPWIANQIKSNISSKLWFPGGKYVLYFLEIPHDLTISQRFSLVDPSTRESMDQTRLEWIPCECLSNAVKERSSRFTLPEGEQHFFGFFMEMMGVKGVVKHLLNLRSTLGPQ